jgi:ubiquinone/menaquinone biosynthesis C-methylase UbiE
MNEQSKAARRRYADGTFHSRYFVGSGLDIGAGSDSVGLFVNQFRLIHNVQAWDVEQGDAQYLRGLEDNSFDFVHSSHCLEHMVEVGVALYNWLRVLKPGGHLIVTVPDEDLYEQGIWPSKFNPDHKHTFTICKATSWSPVSINVVDLVKDFCDLIVVERIIKLSDFTFSSEKKFDQSLLPNAECAIEFIWKKK